MSGPAVIAQGCRLNAAEAETMARLAAGAGLADAAIVNTCAVTAQAAKEAGRMIRRLRRERPEARIVVTGCAAQIDPARFAAMPEIDHLLGAGDKLDPAAWARIAADPSSRGAMGDVFAARGPVLAATAPLGGRTRAHLAVQTGCDHRCTFCVIPFGRGRARSVPVDAAVTEARRLVEAGAREIVLTGVDLTSWGSDLDGRPRLGALVAAILNGAPELPRLRLSSLDSVEIDPELFDLAASEAWLMPHLHLSLQAGDDLILKRMRRRHSSAQAIALCADLRRRRPDIVFGADLIAGFPTETEAMFLRTRDLIAACGLTYVHAFPFSPRPGTPAARMPQVAAEAIQERAARLREAGAAALQRHLAGEIGRTRAVLTEKGGVGRTEGFTPVRFPQPIAPGRIVMARIAGHDGRELIAA